MNDIIIKPGTIPKDYKKYTCKKCNCEFAKPGWDYEKVNTHPGYGCIIVEFVRCPNCDSRISI